jgi:hypothetical protein
MREENLIYWMKQFYYNTIKKCIELRQQYEEACIEKQDTNHHTEISNRINGISNCQNVFDFLLGKII